MSENRDALFSVIFTMTDGILSNNMKSKTVTMWTGI